MPAHAVKYVQCRRNITDMWSRNVRRKIGQSSEMWSHQGSSNSGIMEFRMEFVIRMLKVVRLLMLRISQTCHMPWNIYATTWHTHRHVYTETSNHFEFMTTKNITQLWTQNAQLLLYLTFFPGWTLRSGHTERGLPQQTAVSVRCGMLHSKQTLLTIIFWKHSS